MSIPTTTGDVFIYRSRDPHTAIPDWLAFCRTVSADARNMAHAILILSRGPLPPTRAEIAEALGVDVRTIQRWLLELRTAGILSEQPVGRRVLCIFSNPAWVTHDVMGDTWITRPADHPTSRSPDPCVTHDPLSRDQFLGQQEAVNSGFSRKPISDPPVGVVGDQQSRDSDPTSTNRAPLKTALARWLKRAGMNAAREFDDPALDYATYREFVEYKRSLGWEWRQIVSTLREAPLEPIADDQADDFSIPSDELARIDSTSMALARRVEADKAEAAARAWPPKEGSK